APSSPIELPGPPRPSITIARRYTSLASAWAGIRTASDKAAQPPLATNRRLESSLIGCLPRETPSVCHSAARAPTMPRMTPRIALVTGASSGIGAAIARRLASDGWQVLAAGRDAGRTSALATGAPGIRPWVGGLATSADADRLVADCIAAFAGLDLLVNNAGIYEIADAERTTDDSWQRTIAINLSMPFYLSRAALPELRKRQGAIINIASDWGLKGGAKAVAYCASKGG